MSLADARAVVRGGGRATRGDRLYRVYLAVLAFWIYVGPMAAAGARALASDAAWSSLRSPATLAGLAAALQLAALLVLRVAPTIGAVRPRSATVSFLVGSAHDRGRVLRGAWTACVAVLGLVALALGADVVASRALAGAWSRAWLLPAVVAGCTGVSLAGLWLRGQAGAHRGALSTAALTTLGIACAATLLDGATWRAAMLLAGPGGWFALTLTDPAAPWSAAATTLAVALTAWLVRARGLLRSLRAHDLAAQAGRVDGVSTGIARGNLLATSDALSGSARGGRDRVLSASTRSPIARRDLLGLLRAPETTAAGVVLVAAGSVVGGLTVAHGWPVLPGVIACGLAALGLHLLCGGLHAHATTAHRDSWLGLSFREVAMAHTWTPYLVAVATWWVVTAALAPIGAAPSFSCGALVLVVLLVAEVAACHRGDLPPGVTGPVTAELGDTGAVMRALWLIGMPLLGVAVGGGVLALAASPLAAGAVGVVGLLVLGGFAHDALGRATAR